MNQRRVFRYAVLTMSVIVLASACASTRPVSDQFDDATITAKIKTKLAGDPEINPFNIDVDTFDGVVTLRGEVEKQKAKDEAEHHALNTGGVQGVVNEIRVVSEAFEDDERATDAWITTKVKSKIAADPQLNPFNIDVDTLDGRVTLSGRVRTVEARQEAEKLARDTDGVVEVVNELRIGGD